MDRRNIKVIFLFAFLSLIIGMRQAIAQAVDNETLERGKYLVITGGCNDCHTHGYLQSDGKTPEDEWLKGSNFGWRGPWGTTYGSNLRILVPKFTEDQWVAYAKSLRSRPTMPWFNLNKTNEEDLRAMYQFIVYLGPAGKPAPAYVPPDEEPDTPYALFPSPPSK